MSWNWSLNFSSRQSKFWLFLSICLFAVYIHGIAHFTFISFLFECLNICPEYQLKNRPKFVVSYVFFYCNSLECCRFSELLNNRTISHLLGLRWHLLMRWQKLLLQLLLLLILYFPRGSLTPMEYNVYCQNKSKLELSFFCFLGKSNLGRFASEYPCFTIIVKLRIFLHTKSLKE